MSIDWNVIRSAYYYAAAHPEESWEELGYKFGATKVFDFSTGKVIATIPRPVWLARYCITYWLKNDLVPLQNPRFKKAKKSSFLRHN